MSTPANAPPTASVPGRSVLTVVALWSLVAVGLVAVLAIAAVTFFGKPAPSTSAAPQTTRTTEAVVPVAPAPPTSFVNTDLGCIDAVEAAVGPTRDDVQAFHTRKINEAEAVLAGGSEQLRGLNAGLIDSARNKLNTVAQVYYSIGTRVCPKMPTETLLTCIRAAFTRSAVQNERIRIQTSQDIIESTGSNLSPGFDDVIRQQKLQFLELYQNPDIILAADVLACDPDAPPMTKPAP